MRHISLRTLTLLLTLASVVLMASCLDDDDSPTVDYSTLRAELGMLHFGSSHQVTSFTNDSNETYYFATEYQFDAYTADSTYRALIYYYDASQQPYVELYAFSDVFVCEPVDIHNVEEVKTDPVYFQSAWFSNNANYLNIVVELLYASSTGTQRLFVVREENEENGRTRLTLYHDQNDVPEYYSGEVYISVPLRGYFASGEEIELVVNTYDAGAVTMEYTIPNL